MNGSMNIRWIACRKSPGFPRIKSDRPRGCSPRPGRPPSSGGWPSSSRSTCADNNRALMALMGITGNIDVPGGQVLFRTAKIRNVGQFGAHKMLPYEQAQKRLGGERFRLAGNFAIINPKCVWDAILEEKPYPVKMLFFISSNPVLTRANAGRSLSRP